MPEKVLIIEDEDSIAATMEQLLSIRYEVDVAIASSIAEAEEFLEKSQFRVIVVDNFLPDGAGFKMVCDIADTQKWIYDAHLIFLSGVYYVDMMPEFAESVEKFSKLHVRNKPITAETLYEMVDGALTRHPSKTEGS